MQRFWNSLVFLSGMLLSQTLVILCPSRPSLFIGLACWLILSSKIFLLSLRVTS
jgi:hypothetical protein